MVHDTDHFLTLTLFFLMTEEQTYNELLSMRAMAQMVVQNADRLIKEMHGDNKVNNKIQKQYLEHKARLRARRTNKKAAV